MRAGALRNRIQIQAATASTGDYGEEIKTWATLISAWAEISPLMGREYVESAQVQAAISHRIRLRYRSDVDLYPTQRVVAGSKIYDIVSVQEVETRHREWVLMCLENIND